MLIILTILLLLTIIASSVVFFLKLNSIASRMARSFEQKEPWKYTDEEFIDDVTATISATIIPIFAYFLAILWHIV